MSDAEWRCGAGRRCQEAVLSAFSLSVDMKLACCEDKVRLSDIVWLVVYASAGGPVMHAHAHTYTHLRLDETIW